MPDKSDKCYVTINFTASGRTRIAARSFPRRRESSVSAEYNRQQFAQNWIPAFAGMTIFRFIVFKIDYAGTLSADSLAYPDTIPARLAKSAASKAEKVPLFIDLKRGKSGHNQTVPW